MYATYRREYENFTHIPGESIDALFQSFMVVVNNMRTNVDVLPYDDHDRAGSYTLWIVQFGAESSKPLLSQRSMTL
jgi:hypothetical protein